MFQNQPSAFHLKFFLAVATGPGSQPRAIVNFAPLVSASIAAVFSLRAR